MAIPPKTTRPSKASRTPVVRTPDGTAIDIERYVPALLTLVTSRLSAGASSDYLSVYAVGIETWRILVMLAFERRVTAQRMVQMLGADKGGISRTFKRMAADGLITQEDDESDGRLRHAVLTPKGRTLHDRMIRLALVREKAALHGLADAEVETLRDLLRRVHANLPRVESASAAFIRQERASLGLSTDAPALRRRGKSTG